MPVNIVRAEPSVASATLDQLKNSHWHPVLQRVFAQRGIQSLQELDCSVQQLANYNQLLGIDAAVVLLCNAISEDQKIVIVGDFDADGATSTALCLLALTEMGAKHVDHLVPNRFEFGYGLTPQIVDIAAEQGAQLIVTVDNGISCHAGVSHAKSLGIRVLVTDHHLPAEQLPEADAIVNPNQPGCLFPSKSLAGVGVAFYVLLALRAKLHELGWFTHRGQSAPNLANYLDLVAVGTVADVVPLDSNNRILVHQGIQRIRAGKCRPGILALLNTANRQKEQLTSTDLGFVLGPRLNAAGRLDDMSLGIACLLTHDHQHATNLAIELDRLNQERKQIEQSMQQDALAALEGIRINDEQLPHGLVVYQPTFHAGVVGIVAGRLKEKLHRPTIVFANDSETLLKGSARSISGVHIRDVFELVNSQNPGLIIKFGGHAMAAGLSIERDKLDQFQRAFETALEQWQDSILQSHCVVTDGELDDDCFNLEFAATVKHAAPWGQGFAEPVFDGHFALIKQRIVGEKHLKMVVADANGELLDAIAFNVDTDKWPNMAARSAHLAYKLDVNEFRGKRSLQLLVEAIEV
ncbi:single-stranded-DNA-specific exonuclease RecJ [Alteromonas sp. ASW11-36]|uniref:Single-stranded-DNA-specific exonuclease RecJ n=1 Tax=Alteromonas arenosi TaxID=3055817 RepID=A0ABT7T063_9ALTE|nr:single-stranded-DNA-specific exonuclease RecJ [Alteromonas sp. ASW11-36]MDM7861815.1 single-stranded-DNA-specific exonuclease RecJ [Alteromonas sp. ASW11-36]